MAEEEILEKLAKLEGRANLLKKEATQMAFEQMRILLEIVKTAAESQNPNILADIGLNYFLLLSKLSGEEDEILNKIGSSNKELECLLDKITKKIELITPGRHWQRCPPLLPDSQNFKPFLNTN